MSWLYASMTESMIGKILSYSTAFEIWEALSRSYGSSTSSRQLEFMDSPHQIKKDGLSVEGFVSKFKEVYDKLPAIGYPLSQREQLMYTFQGLGVCRERCSTFSLNSL